MEIMPDHVHLFVESDPGMAPAKIAAQLKGYTSRVSRQRISASALATAVFVESVVLHRERRARVGSDGAPLYRAVRKARRGGVDSHVQVPHQRRNVEQAALGTMAECHHTMSGTIVRKSVCLPGVT